jgi:hypothetical protein
MLLLLPEREREAYVIINQLGLVLGAGWAAERKEVKKSK